MKKLGRLLRERWAHWPFAGITLAGLVTSFYFIPDLRKDVATGFATFTGFVTIYGLVFAAVEVLRLKSVTELTQRVARQTESRVRAISSAKNLTECQSCIEYALEDIDKSGSVGSSPLARIVKFYSYEFIDSMHDDLSIHRTNVSLVNSYIGSYRVGNNSSTGRLRSALADMMVQLSIKRDTGIQEFEE